MAQGGSKHMCYMVLFVLLILWLLYWSAFSKRSVTLEDSAAMEQPVLIRDSMDSGSG